HIKRTRSTEFILLTTIIVAIVLVQLGRRSRQAFRSLDDLLWCRNRFRVWFLEQQRVERRKRHWLLTLRL
ncbi:hypothetical protein BDR03DRAFT_969257, partial [Suillus americanus]